MKKNYKIYADISEEKVYIQTNTLTLQLKKFQYSVKQKHEYNLLYLPAHEDLWRPLLHWPVCSCNCICLLDWRCRRIKLINHAKVKFSFLKKYVEYNLTYEINFQNQNKGSLEQFKDQNFLVFSRLEFFNCYAL